MTASLKKIAINTGGGDAPGLNAVIHGAVYAARKLGWEIVGIREGYDGLLEPKRFPDGGLMELYRSTVREIPHLGGTILGTTNRGNPFHCLVEHPDEANPRLTVPIRCFTGFAIITSTLSLPSAETAASLSQINCTKKASALWECPRPLTTILNPPHSRLASTPP